MGAVVQLLASNVNGLTSGKTSMANPALLADAGSYVRIGTMHSTAAIGVCHLDGVSGPTTEGITPVAWPGGFGAWGLLWIVFDYVSGTTGTLSVRINGVDVASETLRVSRGSLGVDTAAAMGATGGGTNVAAFRLAEFMVYPGQAFNSAALAAKETYFAARYPSLGV